MNPFASLFAPHPRWGGRLATLALAPVAAALLLAGTVPAAAHGYESEPAEGESAEAQPAAESAPSESAAGSETGSEAGFYGAVFGVWERTAGHVQQLAQAVPADKYGWRPAEGVRSVGEVYLHIAGANFFLSSQLGTPPPEDLGVAPDAIEKVEGKDRIVALLERSIDHARGAIEATRGQDLDREVHLFGQQMTARTVVMILNAHLNEHLGQSIAYARSNGVVPPWSGGDGDGGDGAADGEEDGDDGS